MTCETYGTFEALIKKISGGGGNGLAGERIDRLVSSPGEKID